LAFNALNGVTNLDSAKNVKTTKAAVDATTDPKKLLAEFTPLQATEETASKAWKARTKYTADRAKDYTDQIAKVATDYKAFKSKVETNIANYKKWETENGEHWCDYDAAIKAESTKHTAWTNAKAATALAKTE
jgi:hypothetical protein